MFFSLLATTGAASIPQLRRVSFELFEHSVLFVVLLNMFNDKIKGLTIQCIFHDCFGNGRDICIQYICQDCFENSRGKWMEHIFLRQACT